MIQEITKGQDLDALWERQLDLLSTMDSMGTQNFFTSPKTIERVFRRTEPDCVACIDGGIPVFSRRRAGSGILADADELKKYVHINKVQKLTTHYGCGAAALKFPQASDVDAVAQEWGQHTAHTLGLDYFHIPKDQMLRGNNHPESIIVVDGTGLYFGTPELLRGFVVTRLNSSNRTAIKDVKLGIKIALGNTGYGDRFTRQNPLRIIVIGHYQRPDLSAYLLADEVRSGLMRSSQFTPSDLQRIRIETVDTTRSLLN